MNRPFGAVDVSANLKGAVPKTATQKILVALAEKGELVQKTYGALGFLDWDYNYLRVPRGVATPYMRLFALHVWMRDGVQALAMLLCTQGFRAIVRDV